MIKDYELTENVHAGITTSSKTNKLTILSNKHHSYKNTKGECNYYEQQTDGGGCFTYSAKSSA